ncbi:MAG TPA: LysR family transcriptional regulator [Candidatus Coprovicinus avistercoris]|uniref:LysR family transcriptional regulator n=1 Tax=Candidatus Coprovicinus avistercoris TaxID=2840754 RepID=A0A9D1L4A3_9ACTN|nr:LysR family transcriptional regulator [Candidatus Coprovicinus avistercoris]
MLLKQMCYFCAVVDAGGFTRAADEIYVSQSAISQQVGALEKELGVQLLNRKGRSFTLTAAGEHFYRRASRILDEVDALQRETIDLAHGETSVLRFGYLNRYDGWEVAGAVAAFVRRHPHMTVESFAGSHDTLRELLTSGQVDLTFSDRRRTLHAEAVNLPLFVGYDYIEVSEASPLARHETVTVADLNGQTGILIAAPDQEDVERTFFQDTMGFHCDVVFARTIEEARMMVAGGRNFLPIETRSQEKRSGFIIRRIPLNDVNGDQLRHEYYAFWLRERTNPYIEEFGTILQELFSQSNSPASSDHTD